MNRSVSPSQQVSCISSGETTIEGGVGVVKWVSGVSDFPLHNAHM